MIITTEEIEQTIRPLVYGVRDEDGVVSAIVNFIEQYGVNVEIDTLASVSSYNRSALPTTRELNDMIGSRISILRKESPNASQ